MMETNLPLILAKYLERFVSLALEANKFELVLGHRVGPVAEAFVVVVAAAAAGGQKYGKERRRLRLEMLPVEVVEGCMSESLLTVEIEQMKE